ncbi:hypothetical protein D9M70_650560 [compost metagenome]
MQSITGRNTHHNRFKQNLRKHLLRADDSGRPKRFAPGACPFASCRRLAYIADIYRTSASALRRCGDHRLASAKDTRPKVRFNQTA